MTPDLYGAWLTAGNNLQTAGGWLADHWVSLTILAAALAFAWWLLRADFDRSDYRTRNDRVAAWRITADGERPEPGEPGSDRQLLDQCRAIHDAEHIARKEKPQP